MDKASSVLTPLTGGDRVMRIVGLAGPARVGKDTVADYLVKVHGYRKFSFSDALYREVSMAYNVPIALLLDSRMKDICLLELMPNYCTDQEFVNLILSTGLAHNSMQPLSPRRVLQWWGTEYRRAQDPMYWVRAADDWLQAVKTAGAYDPEGATPGVVNTSVRFDNEYNWIKAQAGGEVWHMSRDNLPRNDNPAHISETPLAIEPDDGVIYNNGSVTSLHFGLSIMLARGGRQLTVLPEEVA